jgi:hypothetical protein
LGHFIFVPLATPAHQNKSNATITIANKTLTHFFIAIHLSQKKEEKGETVFPLKSFSL